MTEEEWKPIPEWSDYEASSFGRLRRVSTGNILKPAVNARGYLVQNLVVGPGLPYKQKRVHRLVCAAFYPNPEGKEEVNHKDLCKTNNVASNLEWATRAENLKHASDAGLFRAITNPKNQQKLSPADVIELRALFASGVKPKALAERFGIHPCTARNTALGLRRPHG